MEVHRELGPGLDELFYQGLLSRKLLAAGIPHLSKPRQPLLHRGMTADIFEPDLVFSCGLIGELKCLTGEFDGEHYVQLICYLKFWKIGVGLLFDFAKESLNSRRVQFSEPQFELPELKVMLAACPARNTAETAALQICDIARARTRLSRHHVFWFAVRGIDRSRSQMCLQYCDWRALRGYFPRRNYLSLSGGERIHWCARPRIAPQHRPRRRSHPSHVSPPPWTALRLNRELQSGVSRFSLDHSPVRIRRAGSSIQSLSAEIFGDLNV
jgi:GxxExxY protein